MLTGSLRSARAAIHEPIGIERIRRRALHVDRRADAGLPRVLEQLGRRHVILEGEPGGVEHGGPIPSRGDELRVLDDLDEARADVGRLEALALPFQRGLGREVGNHQTPFQQREGNLELVRQIRSHRVHVEMGSGHAVLEHRTLAHPHRSLGADDVGGGHQLAKGHGPDSRDGEQNREARAATLAARSGTRS